MLGPSLGLAKELKMSDSVDRLDVFIDPGYLGLEDYLDVEEGGELWAHIIVTGVMRILVDCVRKCARKEGPPAYHLKKE